MTSWISCVVKTKIRWVMYHLGTILNNYSYLYMRNKIAIVEGFLLEEQLKCVSKAKSYRECNEGSRSKVEF